MVGGQADAALASLPMPGSAGLALGAKAAMASCAPRTPCMHSVALAAPGENGWLIVVSVQTKVFVRGDARPADTIIEMWTRLVVLCALAGCGRVRFDAVTSDAVTSDDACAAACTDLRCGEPDGCGGTCTTGCCVDECPVADTLQCTAATQRTCTNVDADPCLEWGWDVPCSSGACAGATTCTYSTCPTAPISEQPSFTASGGGVCSTGDPAAFPWKLVQTAASTPIVVDGMAMIACVMADFGATCAPRQVCANATADEAMCGDTCQGTCAECEGFGGPLVATLWVFGSPTPDLERFRQRGRVAMAHFPSANGSCIGISPFETRYVLVCRPACGPDGLDIAASGFQLAN